jgi:hypothetical protein
VIDYYKQRILSCRDITEEFELRDNEKYFEVEFVWNNEKRRKVIKYAPGDEKEIKDLWVLSCYEFCLGIRIDINT